MDVFSRGAVFPGLVESKQETHLHLVLARGSDILFNETICSDVTSHRFEDNVPRRTPDNGANRRTAAGHPFGVRHIEATG